MRYGVPRLRTCLPCVIVNETLKTAFQVATAMKWNIVVNGVPQSPEMKVHSDEKYVENSASVPVKEGDIAKFEVTRTGKTDIASSVFWRTIEGTAQYVTDFEQGNGTVGFSIGETKKFIEKIKIYICLIK